MLPFFLIQLRSVILSLAGLALFCGLIFRAVFGTAKMGINTPTTGVWLIGMEATKNTFIIALFVTFAVTYRTKWFPFQGRIVIFTVTFMFLIVQVVEVSYYHQAKKTRPDGCPQCQYLECTTKFGGCFFLAIYHYVNTMAAFLGLLEVILTSTFVCHLELTNAVELIPPATSLTPRPHSNAVEQVPPAPLAPRFNSHAVDIDHPCEALR
ncbi:hypothetical protein BGZ92_008769 [Podila epicladia]|nr:hypothetical protein BGZ92_008769 [Podila epicladia]